MDEGSLKITLTVPLIVKNAKCLLGTPACGALTTNGFKRIRIRILKLPAF